MTTKKCVLPEGHESFCEYQAEAATRAQVQPQGAQRELDAAYKEIRKHLAMNEGEDLVGGIRNLAQANVLNRSNSDKAMAKFEAADSRWEAALKEHRWLHDHECCSCGAESTFYDYLDYATHVREIAQKGEA